MIVTCPLELVKTRNQVLIRFILLLYSQHLVLVMEDQMGLLKEWKMLYEMKVSFLYGKDVV